jgi:hypothetical protein
VAHRAGENFPGVDASHQEFKVISVIGDTVAALHKNSYFKRLVAGSAVKRIGVIGDHDLCGAQVRGKEESDHDEGDGADALHISNH